MDEAVEFALRAGKAFEKEPAGEYRETIIGELGASVGELADQCSGMPGSSYSRDQCGSEAECAIAACDRFCLQQYFWREQQAGMLPGLTGFKLMNRLSDWRSRCDD